MMFRYQGSLKKSLAVAAVVVSSIVVKAQTASPCTICPPGSNLTRADQSVGVFDGTCGDIQSLLDRFGGSADIVSEQLAEACNELLGNVPFVDLQSFCGCTGVEQPRICRSVCGTEDTPTIYFDRVVTLPGLNVDVTCEDAASLANYLTDPLFCELIGEICCFEDDDGDGQPDEPFEDILGGGSEDCTSVCSDGSDVGLPDKNVGVVGFTCGQLQDAITNNETDTGDLNVCGTLSTLGPFIDFEGFCGCPGAEMGNGTGICPVCANGGSVSTSTELPIDFLGVSLSCTDAAAVANHLKNEVVCNELVGLFDTICCTDATPDAGLVEMETAGPSEAMEGATTEMPTVTETTVETEIVTETPVDLTETPVDVAVATTTPTELLTEVATESGGDMFGPTDPPRAPEEEVEVGPSAPVEGPTTAPVEGPPTAPDSGDGTTPPPTDSTEPDSTEPDSTEPDSTEPDSTEPDVSAGISVSNTSMIISAIMIIAMHGI